MKNYLVETDLLRVRVAKKDYYTKPPGDYKQLDLENIPNGGTAPEGLTRAFMNNRYTIMIYDDTQTTKGPASLVLVQRHDSSPIPNHWAEMQNIKNLFFGEETTAVEYYPAESNLSNASNIYWLWVFPDGVLPVWKSGDKFGK